MRNLSSIVLAAVLAQAMCFAQTPIAQRDATKPIQQSQSIDDAAPNQPEVREVNLARETPIEVESAYTVSSLNLRPNDYLSFRVLIPIRVDGITVIPENALVTGRVFEARRGRHWGKAGRLSWIMLDVVAIDGTRVPLHAHKDLPNGREGIKGTSRGGQVATEMAVFGALLLPFSPLVLMSGFRRGDDAILPQGQRFIVFVQSDTNIKAAAKR